MRPSSKRPHDGNWFHRQRHRLLIGVLALALVLTAGASAISNSFSNAISSWIPGTWVYAAALQTLQHMDSSELGPSRLSADEQSRINSDFAALRIPGNETLPYELVFRDGRSFGASAFSLAGGIIVVSDELVVRSSRQELMSRLLLELGYLRDQHALRATTARNPVRLLLAILGNREGAAVRLMSAAQPVLEHTPRSEAQARQFRDMALSANLQAH